MSSQRTPQVTIFGNLGSDPQTRTFKGRTVTREFYDPIIDDVVTREFDNHDREFLTASLAVNTTVDGEKLTRWKNLVDFNNLLTAYRKGDRLKVRGYFRDRQYTNSKGETKTFQQFIVTAANLERLRIRQQAD